MGVQWDSVVRSSEAGRSSPGGRRSAASATPHRTAPSLPQLFKGSFSEACPTIVYFLLRWNSHNNISYFKVTNSVTFSTFTTCAAVPFSYKTVSSRSSIPPPSPWQSAFWFCGRFVSVEFILSVVFCVCLLSVSITFLRFIHIVACVSASFLWLKLHFMNIRHLV